MKKLIDGAISKLEKIPVSGVNAILMGDALKELILARDKAPEETEETEEKEGEEDVNSND